MGTPEKTPWRVWQWVDLEDRKRAPKWRLKRPRYATRSEAHSAALALVRDEPWGDVCITEGLPSPDRADSPMRAFFVAPYSDNPAGWTPPEDLLETP